MKTNINAEVAASPALYIARILAGVWVAASLIEVAVPDLATFMRGAGGLLLFGFMLAHACATYGVMGLALFSLIAGGIALMMEASSIAFGVPFGFFVHNMAGPRILSVPLPVIVGWVVLGWLAWTLARLLSRPDPVAPTRLDRFITPLVGTLVLGGYDLVVDPGAATVDRLFSYRAPSGLFGVPLANFVGWVLTGWLMMQAFALIEWRLPPRPAAHRRDYWVTPLLIWLLMPLSAVAAFLQAGTALVTAGDRSFHEADVREAAIICALFSTVLVAVLGMARLAQLPRWLPAEGAGGSPTDIHQRAS